MNYKLTSKIIQIFFFLIGIIMGIFFLIQRILGNINNGLFIAIEVGIIIYLINCYLDPTQK